MRLAPVLAGGVLHWQPDDSGRTVGVVVEVDGPRFSEVWLAAVKNAQERNSLDQG